MFSRPQMFTRAGPLVTTAVLAAAGVVAALPATAAAITFHTQPTA